MKKQPPTVAEQPRLQTNTTFRFPLERLPTEADAVMIPARTLGRRLFAAMNALPHDAGLGEVYAHTLKGLPSGDKIQARITAALKSKELWLFDPVLRFPTEYREELGGLCVSSSDLKAWATKFGWMIEYYCPLLEFIEASEKGGACVDKTIQRSDAIRSFLIDAVKEDRSRRNPGIMWEFIRNNAGKENFFFATSAEGTATTSSGRRVTKKQITDRLSNLPEQF